MWEDRYKASDDYLFGTAPAGVLTENPGWLRPGDRALCVSDGEGRNSVHLAEQGLQVTSFDPAPTAVARGRKLAEARGVSVESYVSDWQAWDWDAVRYDLVAAIFIQYADPVARARQFADLRSTVRPGGVLILHGYTPEQVEYGTGGPPNAAHMYTEGLLRDAFGGWHIQRLAAYEREVDEGKGHRGRSALIDLIARKPAPKPAQPNQRT